MFTNPALSSQDKVDLLLKARGLQAEERFEKLTKKKNDSKAKTITQKELCEYDYESVYYAFAHKELSKIVKKPVFQQAMKESMAFIFIIPDQSGGIGFQMNYIYAKKEDAEPIMNEISTIKDGWRVKISKQLPNKLIVNSPTCYFEFSLTNPFDSKFEVML